MHVGIDVNERIATNLLTTVFILLNGKLSQLWQIVRGFILGEERHTATQLHTQHTGYLELQIEVGEEIEGWQGQHIFVAGVLVCQHILPIDDTQAEMLHQLGCQHIDVATLLIDAASHSRTVVGLLVNIILHAEVAVVLYLVDSHTQASICLLIFEVTFYVGMCLATQILIPPEVFGMVAIQIESRVETFEEGFGSQSDSIAQQREVEVGVEVYFHVTGIYAR